MPNLKASPVTVPDFSFEYPVVAPGGNSGTLAFFTYGPAEPWHGGGNGNGGVYFQNISTNNYQTAPGTPGTLPPTADGTNYLHMGVNGQVANVWQDIGPVQPNTIYTLTIAYGQDVSGADSGGGLIGLVNGSNPFTQEQVLGETNVDSGSLTPGTFADATVVVTTGNQVSGDLTIWMHADSGMELDFDNVRLDATAAPSAATALTPLVSPTNQVFAGQSVTLSENPAGQTPFTYQWLSDNGTYGASFSPISGATGSNYVVDTSGFAAGAQEEYAVVVENGSGSSTSAPVTLTIFYPAAPSLVRDTLPGDAAGGGSSATVGDSVTFSALFTGSVPISYQWQFTDTNGNMMNIPGATNATLTLTDLQLTNTGFYSVTASNALATTPSTPSLFYVNPPTQSGNLTLSTANQEGLGGATSFSPSWPIADGSLIAGDMPGSYDTNPNDSFGFSGTGGLPVLTDGAFGYIWQAGLGSAALASCGQPGNGVGTYAVYSLPASTYGYNITNIVVYGGWTDSGRNQQSYNIWYSTVADPTNFILAGNVNYNPPDSGDFQSGTRVSITSTNGVIAQNVAAIKFDFTPSQKNGWEGYAELQVFGAPATTTSNAPPVLTQDTLPAYGSDVVGSQVAFTAAFASFTPLTYQWRVDTGSGPVPISGATNATLTLTNLQLADSGSYSLVASNAAGVAVSTPSPLVVHPLPGADANEIFVSTAHQAGPAGSLFTPTWEIAPGIATNSLIAGDLPIIADQIGVPGFAAEDDAGGVAILTDGQFGHVGQGDDSTLATCGTGAAGKYLVYALTSAPYGYDLTNIVVYGGWSDSGRDQQAYTLYYSTVTDPTNFIELDSVSYLPTNNAAVPNATRVTLTSASGAPMARNVAAVKFDFTTPGGENGYEGYSEVQLFGSPSASVSVPAPVLTQDINPAVGEDVVGSQVTFTAGFNSTSPITYQWQKDGVDIAGATGPTLTLHDLKLSDSGSYDVVASTTDGTAVSSTNTFTVNPAPSPVNGVVISPALQSTFPSGFTFGGFMATWNVANDSLIAGQLPGSVGSGSFTLAGSRGLAALTDGSIAGVGAGNYVWAMCGSVGSGAGNSATYTLAGSASGYDLTNIVVYGGWNDGGRDQQAYTLDYATAGDPTNFVPLSSVSYLPTIVTATTNGLSTNGLSVPNITRVTLTSSGAGPLATNVVAVKFDFTSPAGENGYEGYAELQVFGTPSAAQLLPVIGHARISAGNLILTGAGGSAGGGYTWLTTTNLALPLADWTTNSTGVFNSSGAFSNAIPINSATPSRFFLLRTP